MDIYTRDRDFFKKDEIDIFESAIWTERYYGDGDFQILLPASSDNLSKLPKGQILMCEGFDQPMILETRDINSGILKVTGITLTQWLNNRIIRTTSDHTIREWHLTGKAGEVMMTIVTSFCMTSDYTNGTIDIGIPPEIVSLFIIPGLEIGVADVSGDTIEFSIPFGGVYDALKPIAESYQIGQKITFEFAELDHYMLQYTTYRGEDRTSDQSVNPLVQFSADMDTFTNVSDLESIADHRNFIYTFAPNAPSSLVTGAGFDFNTAPLTPEAGFDLKVAQVFIEEITSDTVGGSSAVLLETLNQKATNELTSRKAVNLVDGQIVETGQIEYGRDYFLGDVIEVEGNTGIKQKARITEYIRSKDSSGERSYPTLSMID